MGFAMFNFFIPDYTTIPTSQFVTLIILSYAILIPIELYWIRKWTREYLSTITNQKT